MPTNADLGLVAHVDEATARTLAKDLKGNLTASGREDVPLVATIGSVATVPAGDGRYRLDLANAASGADPTKPKWPADLNLAAGMSFECRFVVHQKDAAITVPVKAIQPAADGTWAVTVKTADGKGEPRAISRGRVSGDKVEVLSGLESGQVVIVPD